MSYERDMSEKDVTLIGVDISCSGEKIRVDGENGKTYDCVDSGETLCAVADYLSNYIFPRGIRCYGLKISPEVIERIGKPATKTLNFIIERENEVLARRRKEARLICDIDDEDD